MVDISRNTTGANLPAEVSNEIWSNTAEGSAVMALATQVALPGSGAVIPVVTGDAEAGWVSETDEKPVSRGTYTTKNMRAHKLAVIVPFSQEFVRDADTLYNELVNRLPAALAAKFDQTVLHGGASLANFDNLSGAEAVSLGDDAYAGLVEADTEVALGGGILNGFVIAPQGRGILLGSTDTMGRPLFTAGTESGSVNTLLGQPVTLARAAYKAGTPNVVGIAGDWSSARYGTVEGIQISISDQATLTDGAETINLWQRNMVAVRAEIEVGFVVKDVAHFVRLDDAARV